MARSTPVTAARTDRFRALHVPGDPLVMPNAWDLGSARLLVELGATAIATTSGGLAVSLGRTDGEVSRDEVLGHAAAMVAAVDVPVSADLEDGYGDDPADAAEVAHGGSGGLVLTARAENFFRRFGDLDDVIRRLQAYQEAGADVLYAPGLTDAADIARVVAAVDRPVNVLLLAGTPTVPALAELGAARISTGGALARTAYETVRDAARTLIETGSYPFDAPR